MSAQPSTRPTPRPTAGALPTRWERSQARPGRYLYHGAIAAVWHLPDGRVRVHVEDEVTLDQLLALAEDLRALRAWLARGGR